MVDGKMSNGWKKVHERMLLESDLDQNKRKIYAYVRTTCIIIKNLKRLSFEKKKKFDYDFSDYSADDRKIE